MEVGESSSLVPKAPHFFKIMLHEAIQTGKLIIPKKFIRKYGTHLSNSDIVLLKVPTDDAWEVEPKTSNGSVCLERGWPDFLNFYSIKHGDLLVFWHEPGSCSNEFYVVIFDKSSTEIEYPVRPRVNSSEIEAENICEDSVISGEKQDQQPTRRTKRRTSHLQKGGYSTASADEAAPSELERSSGAKMKGKEKVSFFYMKQDTNQGRGHSDKVKAEDDDKEEVCVREADTSAMMHPCFIKRLSKFAAAVPVAFAQATGLWMKSNTLIRDPVGRMWPVKLRLKSYSIYKRIDFGKGWSAFLGANGLAAGDTIKLTYLGGKGNMIGAEILGRQPRCKKWQ